MNAWIVAVGSEMLTPLKVDTNSLAVTTRLNAIGCDVRMKAIVGDDVSELAGVLERGIGTVGLIVCTGGLGPTEDDVTREAAARVMDAPLEPSGAILARIRERFAARGLEMPAINQRQALVPHGATVLENERGTAPGLLMERAGTTVLLLPGPPSEMVPMLESVIERVLLPSAAGRRLVRRVLRVYGKPESEVDSIAAPVYRPWTQAAVPIVTTILASMGQIELHLTAQAASQDEADAALDAAVRELCAVLGPSVYSTDGRTMEAVLGEMLSRRGLTIAVAESCSGGLLASRLTDVPGSSGYFEGAVVSYSNRSKTEWLDVPAALIAEHGAVSEPVATAMARGIRARTGASVGIGITGIAGPGGATPGKPVGTVAIAMTTPNGEAARTFRFPGARDMVKFQSTQAAMNMLRLALDGEAVHRR
ncbi:MAG: competence/damage-inducible protein A [Vicinamibacterales bacterium]